MEGRSVQNLPHPWHHPLQCLREYDSLRQCKKRGVKEQAGKGYGILFKIQLGS